MRASTLVPLPTH